MQKPAYPRAGDAGVDRIADERPMDRIAEPEIAADLAERLERIAPQRGCNGFVTLGKADPL